VHHAPDLFTTTFSPYLLRFFTVNYALRLNLGLSQWVYVRDDMSKGLKIMSLGVINHGMSLSVQANFEKTMFVQA
jgi:hypothetical protein